ncbi:MAG TPA: TRAFs-binding domain-containing protein [Thermoanaerobaculia bacterium]|nr:TRAFs-binding domain-containing protein [Thermoanaerobaculia bacterium]
MAEENSKKRCFVVMGFGKKTDFQSNPQRVLDLDRTYEDIIEPAVTAAGLECIRADKIIHSTLIDKPMYENLLDADLVIADLSTSNANAIYELGIRHALRPHATIVIAEDRFAFPFDINHLSITKYEHMEKEIGFREAMRMRSVLQEKISAIMKRGETDSPVFLFLPHLMDKDETPAVAPTAEPKDATSFADLLELFESTRKRVKQPNDWMFVLAVLDRIQNLQPTDPYLIQQRALATYKSEHPNALESLHAARAVLEALKPDTSSDSETVGLWGAIHKRLWNATGDRAHLDKAIRSYSRGYSLKDDYYNGINYAFLLNVRAAKSEGDDAIADRVLARRVRAEVLALCNAALQSETLSADGRFWITATKAEALCGMGREAESVDLRQTLGPDDWRTKTLDDQLAALRALQP